MPTLPTYISSRQKQYPNRLALWGNVGCGKDTWVATLHYALQNSGFAMRPVDEATAKWQAETRERMAIGNFPLATGLPKSANELTLLTFALSPTPAKFSPFGRQEFVVQIPQAAGGWWSDPQNSRRIYVDAPDPYEFMVNSTGIICLLDPTALDLEDSAVSLMTMLDYLQVYRRRRKERRRMRVALWLTKLDHPQHRAGRGHEEEYARWLFGNRLFYFLEGYRGAGGFEFQWGGCSAIGTILHNGRLRSNSYIDYSTVDGSDQPMPVCRILQPQMLQPDGVIDPIHWVMQPLVRRTFDPRTLFGAA